MPEINETTRRAFFSTLSDLARELGEPWPNSTLAKITRERHRHLFIDPERGLQVRIYPNMKDKYFGVHFSVGPQNGSTDFRDAFETVCRERGVRAKIESVMGTSPGWNYDDLPRKWMQFNRPGLASPEDAARNARIAYEIAVRSHKLWEELLQSTAEMIDAMRPVSTIVTGIMGLSVTQNGRIQELEQQLCRQRGLE
jgi:hypothetical protein